MKQHIIPVILILAFLGFATFFFTQGWMVAGGWLIFAVFCVLFFWGWDNKS